MEGGGTPPYINHTHHQTRKSHRSSVVRCQTHVMLFALEFNRPILTINRNRGETPPLIVVEMCIYCGIDLCNRMRTLEWKQTERNMVRFGIRGQSVRFTILWPKNHDSLASLAQYATIYHSFCSQRKWTNTRGPAKMPWQLKRLLSLADWTWALISCCAGGGVEATTWRTINVLCFCAPPRIPLTHLMDVDDFALYHFLGASRHIAPCLLAEGESVSAGVYRIWACDN